MNIKRALPTYIGTCVPTSGSTTCQVQA